MSETKPVETQDPFTPVRNHEEFEILAQEKTSGDPRLLYLVARHRLDGIHCKRNQREAFEELKLAASENYAPAQLTLAQCYFDGKGTKKDVKAGVDVLRRATMNPRMKYVPALYENALMVLNNKIPNADREHAVKLLRQAVDYEMPEAMFVLGQLFEHGIVIKPLESEAMKLYKKAASHGLPEALERLRRTYSPEDYSKNGLVIPNSLPSSSGLRSTSDLSKKRAFASLKQKSFWKRLWDRLCNWWKGLFGKNKTIENPSKVSSAPMTSAPGNKADMKTPHPFTRVRYVDKSGYAMSFPFMPGTPLPETRPEFIPPVNTLPYTMQPDPEFIKALYQRPLSISEDPSEIPSNENTGTSAKRTPTNSDSTADSNYTKANAHSSVADELGKR